MPAVCRSADDLLRQVPQTVTILTNMSRNGLSIQRGVLPSSPGVPTLATLGTYVSMYSCIIPYLTFCYHDIPYEYHTVIS